ncbi:MAG: hypothetical protein ACKO6N_30000 [Myxococcota bacterium]
MGRRKSSVPGHVEKVERRGPTPYHAAFYQLLRRLLPPNFEVQAEYPLYREPQRIDMLVVRRGLKEEVGAEQELPSLVSHLGEVTLLEFKGPTDVVSGEDISRLLGYGCQYGVMEGRGPEDLTLGLIGSSFGERVLKRVSGHGGRLEWVSQGVWEGHLGGSVLFGLETGELWEAGEHERLWYLLSPGFVREPERAKELTEMQRLVYIMMVDRLLSLSKEERMALTNYEALKTEVEEIMARYMRGLPLEKRLEGLPAEEVLKAYRPEEVLKAYRPEERLAGMKVDDVLKAFKPEELVAALTPEALALLKSHLN